MSHAEQAQLTKLQKNFARHLSIVFPSFGKRHHLFFDETTHLRAQQHKFLGHERRVGEAEFAGGDWLRDIHVSLPRHVRLLREPFVGSTYLLPAIPK